MARKQSIQVDIAESNFGSWRGKPAVMEAPHRHNVVECNFVESGGMHYLLGGRRLHLSAGRFTVFWAARPHQVVGIEPGTRFHLFSWPLAWLLNWKLGDLNAALLNGQVVMEADKSRGSSDLALLSQWHQDLESLAPERRDLALLEMEARLRRLSLSSLDQGNPKPPNRLPEAGLTTAEKLAHFIAEHYLEKLSVETIARSAGLHPNYAMFLYQKAFGISLIESVTHHRVTHAQRLLTTTDRKILDIALDSGFGSASRFYDAFNEICGHSPREFRRTLLYSASDSA
jgi:AraC-like DNA-binding protein